MLALLLDFLSLVIVFFLGYGLRRIGVLRQSDGNTLLKLVFYIGAPALIITTIPNQTLSVSTAWLAGLPVIVATITLLGVLFLRRNVLAHLTKAAFGSLLAGAVIMNTGVLIPVVELMYGNEGLGRLMIIDTMNAVVTFSLIYAAILIFNSKTPRPINILEKILAAPPVWALLIALLLNLNDATLPALLEIPLGFTAGLVGPFILLALGLKFSLTIRRKLLTTTGLAIRFLLGSLVGFLVVWIAGLNGLDAHIVILVAMAPIGFNAMVFAEKEQLDTDYAASLVSIGIIVSAVLLPFTIYGLSILFPL